MPLLNTQKQQQELFDEFVVVKKTRGRFFGVLSKFNKPIFPQHRLNFSISYEMLILVLIAAVLLACVIYALGAERGRTLTGVEIETPAPVVPAVALPAPAPEVPAVLPVEAPKAQPKAVEAAKPAAVKTAALPAAPSADKPYTIQVASYKARDLADKEALRIKASGYAAEVLKKGNYYILCVGSFASKDAAKQTLTVMRKKYGGCIVRKR